MKAFRKHEKNFTLASLPINLHCHHIPQFYFDGSEMEYLPLHSKKHYVFGMCTFEKLTALVA